MKISKILVSQPQPAIPEKAPFYELSKKFKVGVDYVPFIRVEGVSLKEFSAQRVEILAHTAVIFTSRATVDHFFRICAQARLTVPESMKYLCQTEAVALYLQKYIVYRKRKISFADGTFTGFLELIIKNKDEKLVLTLSEPHKPELPEALTRLKIAYSPVVLSRAVAADLSDVNIADYGLLALYSPSDVAAVPVGASSVATFGESTLKAAHEAGLCVMAAAPTPEIPSMAKAVELYLTRLAKGETVAPIEEETLAGNGQKEEFIRTQQSKLARKSRTKK